MICILSTDYNLTAQFIAADGAVDNFLVAAKGSTGSSNLILLHSSCRSMGCQLVGLLLTAQLDVTNRTVDDLFVIAGNDTGSALVVLDYGFTGDMIAQVVNGEQLQDDTQIVQGQSCVQADATDGRIHITGSGNIQLVVTLGAGVNLQTAQLAAEESGIQAETGCGLVSQLQAVGQGLNDHVDMSFDMDINTHLVSLLLDAGGTLVLEGGIHSLNCIHILGSHILDLGYDLGNNVLDHCHADRVSILDDVIAIDDSSLIQLSSGQQLVINLLQILTLDAATGHDGIQQLLNSDVVDQVVQADVIAICGFVDCQCPCVGISGVAAQDHCQSGQNGSPLHHINGQLALHGCFNGEIAVIVVLDLLQLNSGGLSKVHNLLQQAQCLVGHLGIHIQVELNVADLTLVIVGADGEVDVIALSDTLEGNIPGIVNSVQSEQCLTAMDIPVVEVGQLLDDVVHHLSHSLFIDPAGAVSLLGIADQGIDDQAQCAVGALSQSVHAVSLCHNIVQMEVQNLALICSIAVQIHSIACAEAVVHSQISHDLDCHLSQSGSAGVVGQSLTAHIQSDIQVAVVFLLNAVQLIGQTQLDTAGNAADRAGVVQGAVDDEHGSVANDLIDLISVQIQNSLGFEGQSVNIVDQDHNTGACHSGSISHHILRQGDLVGDAVSLDVNDQSLILSIRIGQLCADCELDAATLLTIGLMIDFHNRVIDQTIFRRNQIIQALFQIGVDDDALVIIALLIRVMAIHGSKRRRKLVNQVFHVNFVAHDIEGLVGNVRQILVDDAANLINGIIVGIQSAIHNHISKELIHQIAHSHMIAHLVHGVEACDNLVTGIGIHVGCTVQHHQGHVSLIEGIVLRQSHGSLDLAANHLSIQIAGDLIISCHGILDLVAAVLQSQEQLDSNRVLSFTIIVIITRKPQFGLNQLDTVLPTVVICNQNLAVLQRQIGRHSLIPGDLASNITEFQSAVQESIHQSLQINCRCRRGFIGIRINSILQSVELLTTNICILVNLFIFCTDKSDQERLQSCGTLHGCANRQDHNIFILVIFQKSNIFHHFSKHDQITFSHIPFGTDDVATHVQRQKFRQIRKGINLNLRCVIPVQPVSHHTVCVNLKSQNYIVIAVANLINIIVTLVRLLMDRQIQGRTIRNHFAVFIHGLLHFDLAEDKVFLAFFLQKNRRRLCGQCNLMRYITGKNVTNIVRRGLANFEEHIVIDLSFLILRQDEAHILDFCLNLILNCILNFGFNFRYQFFIQNGIIDVSTTNRDGLSVADLNNDFVGIGTSNGIQCHSQLHLTSLLIAPHRNTTFRCGDHGGHQRSEVVVPNINCTIHGLQLRSLLLNIFQSSVNVVEHIAIAHFDNFLANSAVFEHCGHILNHDIDGSDQVLIVAVIVLHCRSLLTLVHQVSNTGQNDIHLDVSTNQILLTDNGCIGCLRARISDTCTEIELDIIDTSQVAQIILAGQRIQNIDCRIVVLDQFTRQIQKIHSFGFIQTTSNINFICCGHSVVPLIDGNFSVNSVNDICGNTTKVRNLSRYDVPLCIFLAGCIAQTRSENKSGHTILIRIQQSLGVDLIREADHVAAVNNRIIRQNHLFRSCDLAAGDQDLSQAHLARLRQLITGNVNSILDVEGLTLVISLSPVDKVDVLVLTVNAYRQRTVNSTISNRLGSFIPLSGNIIHLGSDGQGQLSVADQVGDVSAVPIPGHHVVILGHFTVSVTQQGQNTVQELSLQAGFDAVFQVGAVGISLVQHRQIVHDQDLAILVQDTVQLSLHGNSGHCLGVVDRGSNLSLQLSSQSVNLSRGHVLDQRQQVSHGFLADHHTAAQAAAGLQQIPCVAGAVVNNARQLVGDLGQIAAQIVQRILHLSQVHGNFLCVDLCFHFGHAVFQLTQHLIDHSLHSRVGRITGFDLLKGIEVLAVRLSNLVNLFHNKALDLYAGIFQNLSLSCINAIFQILIQTQTHFHAVGNVVQVVIGVLGNAEQVCVAVDQQPQLVEHAVCLGFVAVQQIQHFQAAIGFVLCVHLVDGISGVIHIIQMEANLNITLSDLDVVFSPVDLNRNYHAVNVLAVDIACIACQLMQQLHGNALTQHAQRHIRKGDQLVQVILNGTHGAQLVVILPQSVGDVQQSQCVVLQSARNDGQCVLNSNGVADAGLRRVNIRGVAVKSNFLVTVLALQGSGNRIPKVSCLILKGLGGNSVLFSAFQNIYQLIRIILGGLGIGEVHFQSHVLGCNDFGFRRTKAIMVSQNIRCSHGLFRTGSRCRDDRAIDVGQYHKNCQQQGKRPTQHRQMLLHLLHSSYYSILCMVFD